MRIYQIHRKKKDLGITERSMHKKVPPQEIALHGEGEVNRAVNGEANGEAKGA